MISSPRNSVTHNQQAKLAVDYNELLKELSSHEMTSVGCYTIGETIGEGTFGKVKKGFHKLTGRLVAIKKISKQHAPMMAREIHHHRQLKHPNVVMLYEMITTESAIHIISEYCPNGDLLDALTESGRCSETRVHKWFYQLTDAIKYCHTRGIVHRDLKLENILLDADDNVKICDFGFARFTQKNQYLETFCGSLSYSAPEVILRKKYTGPETDIWSLGVILYTLLAGEYPFDDDSEVMTQRKIVQAEYEMPFYFDEDLSDLIRQMLQLEPSERITIDGIIDHPWMTIHEEDYSDSEEEEDDHSYLTPSSSTTTNQSTSDVDSIFSQQDTNMIAAFDESTNTNTDTIIMSPDLKFSPQVRSSLGMTLRPSTHQQQINNKSPRFSAPSLNNNRRSGQHNQSPSSPLLQSTFNNRTSLPSSFNYHVNRDSGVFSSFNDTTLNMTPIEQKLFAALTAAGFDRDALIKMQTGECDTSSTLWHLLLENMSTNSTINHQQKAMTSVPDAFASAIQSRSHHYNNKMAVERSCSPDIITTNKQSVDRGIQTSSNSIDPPLNTNTTATSTTTTTIQPCKEEHTPSPLPTPPIKEQQAEYVQPYPKPPMNRPQHTIHTVGFGSTVNTPMNEKSGWFSSVKSWFGTKQQQQIQQQQQLQMMQQQNELILQHQLKQQQQRSRSSSNCSTMSSPIASPSSYRHFDVVEKLSSEVNANNTTTMIMSPPVYRTGSSGKYRRRVLQLSDPPVSELDQLTYNGTTTTSKSSSNNNINNNNHHNTLPIREYNTTININTLNYHHNQHNIHQHHQVNMPPTALTCSSTRVKADSLSILNASSEPKEIDICEKRYSMMMYKPQQQPTPPPSPPTTLVAATSNTVHDDEEQVVVTNQQQQSINNLLCTPISPIDERAIISLTTTSSDSTLNGAVENDNEKMVNHNSLSDFSSSSDSSSSDDCNSSEEEEEEDTVAPLQHNTLPALTPTTSNSLPMFNNNNRSRSVNRFEFAPRSRLSVYGMQEPRGPPMGTKTIIEEEEEEEE